MTPRFLATTLTLVTLVCSTQISANEQTYDYIDNYSASIYDELVELRRDLYKHPEASGEEKRTSAVVAEYLNDLGLDVKTNIGGYGVVGILKGAKQGRRIAWRADMDAAYYNFKSNAHAGSAQSALGHICGHDVHTAIGLGIANTLSQNVDDLSGTVYFLFQPAEENQKGAKAMISDGLFDLIEADEIYGLHVAPMETGRVSAMPGNMFSHARRITLDFDGTDDYEALTETVNSAVMSLTQVSSSSEFYNLQNITDPVIGMRSPNTIYQDYVTFEGNPHSKKLEDSVVFQTEVYTTEREKLDNVVQSIKDKIANTKYKNRLRSVNYFDEREGVNNDPKLVEEAINTLRNIHGKETVGNIYGQFPFASEDFGHFQRTVPGVYFFLGASNSTLGITAFPHMPDFAVDENSIKIGVTYFSTFILDRLSRPYRFVVRLRKSTQFSATILPSTIS